MEWKAPYANPLVKLAKSKGVMNIIHTIKLMKMK